MRNNYVFWNFILQLSSDCFQKNLSVSRICNVRLSVEVQVNDVPLIYFNKLAFMHMSIKTPTAIILNSIKIPEVPDAEFFSSHSMKRHLNPWNKTSPFQFQLFADN